MARKLEEIAQDFNEWKQGTPEEQQAGLRQMGQNWDDYNHQQYNNQQVDNRFQAIQEDDEDDVGV